MGLDETKNFAVAISRLCGWIYVLCWSLSFYPQPILNIKQRSTRGLVPDFPLLNVFGFTCYTVGTAVFMYSPLVRSQYAARHLLSPEPTVRFNDLAFGVHAFVLTALTYSQMWPTLWRWKKIDGVRRHASKIVLGVMWGCIVGVAIVLIIVLAYGRGNSTDAEKWAWIDVVYAISYVKLVVTTVKYCPQVIDNYRRKSTMGWSIHQILLDFTGGILSILQLIIDSALQADWSGIAGNPVKLGLANISIFFDIVFMTQHYVLYRHNTKLLEAAEEIESAAGDVGESSLSGERRPLLGDN